jgi:hypothetical protein
MIAGFSRSTGETLEVDDDGGFRLVRWSGRAVGRFAGRLDEERASSLSSAVELAASEPSPARAEPWPSEATVERLYGSEGSVLIELTIHDEAPEPWASAVSTCRALMDDLVSEPAAAVGLQLSGPPVRGALRHLGQDPLTVYLDGADVTAVLFRSDGALIASWSSKVGTGTAAAQDLTPGWQQDLGLEEAGFEPKSGEYCQVQVSFTVYDGLPRQAEVTATLS